MLFFHFVCCATAWRLRCCSSPLFFHIFLIFRSADVSTGRLAAGASPSFDSFKRIFFWKFIFIKLELLGCSLGGIWHQVPPAGLELNLNKLARQGTCKVEGNCRRKTAIHLSSGNLTASYYRMACRWNLEQFLWKQKIKLNEWKVLAALPLFPETVCGRAGKMRSVIDDHVAANWVWNEYSPWWMILLLFAPVDVTFPFTQKKNII